MRAVRFASSTGIGPVRLFLPSKRVARLVRSPSSAGIDPVRLLSSRTTCHTCLPEQDTPNQPHGSSDSSHPVRLVQLSPSALL